jgi:signal transduction histidine kinase
MDVGDFLRNAGNVSRLSKLIPKTNVHITMRQDQYSQLYDAIVENQKSWSKNTTRFTIVQADIDIGSQRDVDAIRQLALLPVV